MPDLTLTIGIADDDVWHMAADAWFIDGKRGDADEIDGSIELLRTDLKTVAAAVGLKRVGFKRLSNVVELYVERLSFRMPWLTDRRVRTFNRGPSGNSGDSSASPALSAALGDEAPLVPSPATWAFDKTGSPASPACGVEGAADAPSRTVRRAHRAESPPPSASRRPRRAGRHAAYFPHPD